MRTNCRKRFCRKLYFSYLCDAVPVVPLPDLCAGDESGFFLLYLTENILAFFPLAIPIYGIAKANIAKPSGKSMDSKKRYVVLHHFCVFRWKSDVILEQVFPFPQTFGHWGGPRHLPLLES